MRINRLLLVVPITLALAATATACSSTTSPKSATPASAAAGASAPASSSASAPAVAPVASPSASSSAAPAPVSTPTTAPRPTASPVSHCGTQTAQTATVNAVAKLRPVKGLSRYSWDASQAQTSLYDPCAALSSVVVPIQGSTASSPYAILLFHDGTYLGTATSVQYGFEPRTVRVSPSTIAVTYTYPLPGQSDAEASGAVHASYTWSTAQGRVVMSGGVPPQG